MKVHRPSPPEPPARPRPATAFRDTLQSARSGRPSRPPTPAGPPAQGRPSAGVPVPQVARGTVAIGSTASRARAGLPGLPEQLRQVRSHHEAEAGRLRAVRQEAGVRSEELVEVRVRDLVRTQLEREEGGALPPRESLPTPEGREVAAPARLEAGGSVPQGGERSVQAAVGAAGASTTPAPAGPLKAEALLALVERIEVFVRSQRPALALELGGRVGRRVEVERTGPGEVALTLVGSRGAPAPEELAQLRAAVESKGLRLSRLVAQG